MDKHCIVKGCLNGSTQGEFIGDLCAPCHKMITTGIVHHASPTFIGELTRRLFVIKCTADRLNSGLEQLQAHNQALGQLLNK